MAYSKEIKKMIDKIPKEYHNDIKKIINYCYSLGVSTTQDLIKSIADIPVDKINEYVVCHEDAIAGG